MTSTPTDDAGRVEGRRERLGPYAAGVQLCQAEGAEVLRRSLMTACLSRDRLGKPLRSLALALLTPSHSRG
jgi:hypothetical protein